MNVFRDLERRSRPELHPQIRLEGCFALFYVVSGDLGRLSSKVLIQIKRFESHFVDTELFLIAVFSWFLKSALSEIINI